MVDLAGKGGLEFFGAVITSVSHEIKNRMAIVNEQAGLLADLIHMHGQGREMDPERLMRVADSVRKQVATADGIIKKMNRFAHTVDTLRQPAAVDELLGMTADLAKRMADMHRVTVDVHSSQTPVTVNTSPFFLMNLIWLCISRAIQTIGKEQTILLSCEKTEDGASLWLDMTEAGDGDDTSFPEDVSALADLLEAHIAFHPEKKRLIINLPMEIRAHERISRR